MFPEFKKFSLLQHHDTIALPYTTMEDIKREEGYYWVKFCGRWIVSEWDGNYWIIPGYISASDGTDFEEIDEKRLTHE